MARSFHSSTASSMAPSLSSSESQNSNREHELEIEDEQIFGDDDRNVLVQSDHLQMQSKKPFPSFHPREPFAYESIDFVLPEIWNCSFMNFFQLIHNFKMVLFDETN